ncbi:MAG TPA: adenylate kinase [candidate division Zixibacteria bacterium]|nr:adenylate kinase [candidate division Zixibacteria bacterium]
MKGVMRLILLGSPGVGKGTQALELSECLHILHISTGELLRVEMENKTPIGMKIDKYMNAGELVPDTIIIDMLEKRLQEPDSRKGFVLDGFPRNLNQADYLKSSLERLQTPLDRAINIAVPIDTVLNRLLQRNRSDDTPQTIKYRLEIYKQETIPLIDYYQRAGILEQINGDASPEEVTNRILACIA